MKICQVLFCFAALFHIPITLFPAREQIFQYYGIEKTYWKNFFITCLLTFIGVFIPCVYPDITGLLGLLGGITVGTSGYYVPLLLKVIDLRRKSGRIHKKIFYGFLLIATLTFGIGSTYISITTGGGGH